MQTQFVFIPCNRFVWPIFMGTTCIQTDKKKLLNWSAFRISFSSNSAATHCMLFLSSTSPAFPFTFCVLFYNFGVYTRLLTSSLALLLFTDAERFGSVTCCWLLLFFFFVLFFSSSSFAMRLCAMHFHAAFSEWRKLFLLFTFTNELEKEAARSRWTCTHQPFISPSFNNTTVMRKILIEDDE